MNVTKTFKTSIGVKTVTTDNETNNDSDNNTPVCFTQLMDQPEYTQTEDEETINSDKLQSDTDNESINGDDTNHHPIFKQDTNHTPNHTDENVAMTRQDKNTLSSLHIVPASLRKKNLYHQCCPRINPPPTPTQKWQPHLQPIQTKPPPTHSPPQMPHGDSSSRHHTPTQIT